MNLEGRWVVVTGASSGLGRELARELVLRHKANLVLVARRADRLAALKDELEKGSVRVVPLVADLSDPAQCRRAFAEAVADRDVGAVVLNAGVTFFGRVLEQTPESVMHLVNTNVAGVAVLTHLFARHLVAQQRPAALMLVSSLGGSGPVPFQAVYAAGKAFTTSLGCALAAELKGTNVSVTVFAPGGMATEMGDATGLGAVLPAGHPSNMHADVCARIAIGAMQARTLVCVPGWLNRFVGLLVKFLPRRTSVWLAHRAFASQLSRRHAVA